MALTAEQRIALLDPARVYDAISAMPIPQARGCHALTHTTISPNIASGGQKTNTIPDTVDVEVDIRTVPGTTYTDVDAMLADALGDLAGHVEVIDLQVGDPTECGTDNELWDILARRTQVAHPGATIEPGLSVGGTDARFYRQRGRIAYGAGLYTPGMDAATFGDRFHGHDERIDVDSLSLATEFWIGIANDLLD
jgi:acetylornithine deacetylase/succinyl-diaminopimelate desuccinylase-like protein